MARSTSSVDAAALVAAAVKSAAENWPAGSRVCVALSGGSDSSVLLHAMAALHAKSSPTWALSAHHVHHGLSRNADAWVAHCEAACVALNVPLSIERVIVDTHAGSGTEAAARDARFASLDRVDTDVVLLAQHARDQAETLLLQLLRGSGPPGMAGMPGNTGRYVRPMLSLPKSAILAYAQQYALSWIEDESNADNRFSRNRLRNTAWPALVTGFPAAEATLSRAAQHQAEASYLLDALADIDAASCVFDNTIRLSVFNQLDQPRRANLLRFWLGKNGVGAPATDTLREWLKQLASAAAIQAIELRGGTHEGAIRVYRGHASLVADAAHWNPCRWSGEASLQLGNVKRPVGDIHFVPTTAINALRLPQPGETWLVRARREGDAIKLGERSGHVALKNIFQQANIPPWLRATWPLVTCNDEIAAVASVATAKAFTVISGDSGVACEWKPAWTPISRS